MEVIEKRIPRIVARISDVADMRRIASETLKADVAASVSGLSGSSRGWFLAGMWQALRRPLIVITSQDRGLESLTSDISYFHGELTANGSARVCAFPAWETDPYAGFSPHAEILQARATTLWKVRHNQADVIVTSIRAIATRLVAPTDFDTFSLHISSGDDLSQELLIEHL